MIHSKVINLDELFTIEIRTYIKLSKERALEVEDLKRHKKLGSFIQDLINNYFEGNKQDNFNLQELISRINQLEVKLDSGHSRNNEKVISNDSVKNVVEESAEVDSDLASIFNIS